jgi:hypothetical protein
VLVLLSGGACKQDEGEYCEIDGDCASGLKCEVQVGDKGRCTIPGASQPSGRARSLDGGSTRDAMATSELSAADGAPTRDVASPGDVATTDAASPSDAATRDAASPTDVATRDVASRSDATRASDAPPSVGSGDAGADAALPDMQGADAAAAGG